MKNKKKSDLYWDAIHATYSNTDTEERIKIANDLQNKIAKLEKARDKLLGKVLEEELNSKNSK